MRISLIPDLGGTWFLPRMLGWAKASEIIFTGRTLSANECLAEGLAAEGVAQEATQALFGALARELPASQRDLGYLQLDEEHADRITRLLRYDVLNAYRAMRAAARLEVPVFPRSPVAIFSPALRSALRWVAWQVQSGQTATVMVARTATSIRTSTMRVSPASIRPLLLPTARALPEQPSRPVLRVLLSAQARAR